MAQRDTMIPVCKIVKIAAGQKAQNIALTNTGVSFSEIRYAPEPSCMPNQIMPVIVSATSSLDGEVDLGMFANWVSGTANVHIRDGKIQQIEVTNPGLYDWTVAASNGGVPAVITPQAQLSSISIGPRTIKYKNSIGTVITSSSPEWQHLWGNIASGVDGARTYFGVSGPEGGDTSAIVELTYHQAGGQFTTRILSPGVWSKTAGSYFGGGGVLNGANYQVGAGTSGTSWLDSLSGTFTQVGDRNGGMFDLSSSWYQEVSSFGGDASVGFFMVSSYVSNPFAARFSDPMASPNYVTVTDLSGSIGFFRVSPASSTGFYASGETTNVWSNYATMSADGSALGGVVAAVNSTAVLSVADGISHIDIYNDGHHESYFAINYGVIKQSNTIGDGLHPDVR